VPKRERHSAENGAILCRMKDPHLHNIFSECFTLLKNLAFVIPKVIPFSAFYLMFVLYRCTLLTLGLLGKILVNFFTVEKIKESNNRLLLL